MVITTEVYPNISSIGWEIHYWLPVGFFTLKSGARKIYVETIEVDIPGTARHIGKRRHGRANGHSPVSPSESRAGVMVTRSSLGRRTE